MKIYLWNEKQQKVLRVDPDDLDHLVQFSGELVLFDPVDWLVALSWFIDFIYQNDMILLEPMNASNHMSVFELPLPPQTLNEQTSMTISTMLSHFHQHGLHGHTFSYATSLAPFFHYDLRKVVWNKAIVAPRFMFAQPFYKGLDLNE